MQSGAFIVVVLSLLSILLSLSLDQGDMRADVLSVTVVATEYDSETERDIAFDNKRQYTAGLLLSSYCRYRQFPYCPHA